MDNFLLEICVDSYESARRATLSGADRLELCANLLLGGTSPSPVLVRQVLDRLDVRVNVLLRPRFGDFCFTDEEKAEILWQIGDCDAAGADGVVIGGLNPDGTLDLEFLRECVARAGTMTVTLHRCFDVCRDPFEALEQAAELGIDTILTSGQEAGAEKGIPLLKALQEKAAGRIHLMAGAGVKPENIPLIHEETGITHFHLSGKRTEPGPMTYRREGVPMGLPMASEFDRQYTNPDMVRVAREVLKSL
ncbi:MAG: copper homeostasis protein CutC [Oscillospiraceae bacterium]|nr:copper homeostasis protein CutC [Oscillospiraceae bacterium]